MSVIKRPDGFYWKDEEDDREYGPFATLLEAGRSMQKLQAPPQPDLNEASRAQLGGDEEKRRYRPREDDASVEDALQDWPEEG